MTSLSKPVFIENDPKEIEAGWVNEYETRLGRKLQPGQPERALVSAGAYREILFREKVQAGCIQNLVAFATAPVLDFLGDLVSVTRLPAAPALITITFTLTDDHTGVTIPAGTRVASSDGFAAFATLEDTEVAEGTATAEIECECVSVGIVGNGYLPGEISTILDPQAFILSAENEIETSGGSDEETDEQLRDRIKLAPSAYSTAGPGGAYRYWAKTAHVSIIDVKTTVPEPGTVNVYVHVKDGVPASAEIRDAVALVLNNDNIIPLCDTVVVLSATAVEYEIEVELTAYQNTNQADIITAATEALEALAAQSISKLGFDVMLDEVIKLSKVTGVYKVTTLFEDVIISPTEFAVCTGITVTVTGTNEG